MRFSRIRPIICAGLVLVGMFCFLPAASASDDVWHIQYPMDVPASYFEEPVFAIFGSEHYAMVSPESDRFYQFKGSNNYAASTQVEIEDYGIEKSASSESLGVYVGLAQGGTVLIKADLNTHEKLAALSMPEGTAGQMIVAVGDDAVILGDGQVWRVPMAAFDQVTLLECPGLEQGDLRTFASYKQYLALMSGTNVLSVLRLDDTGYALDAQAAFSKPLSALMLNRDYQRYGLVYGAQSDNRSIWNYFLEDGRMAAAEKYQWPTKNIRQIWNVNGGVYFRDDENTLWSFGSSAKYHLRSFAAYDHKLSIVDDLITDLLPNAMEKFHDVYPKALIDPVHGGSILGSSTSIQANAHDMICINNDRIDLVSLASAGAIAPLDGYPAIMDLKKNYVDLWDMCSYRGSLYMIPTRLYIYVWQINPSLFEKTGIAIPKAGWTMDDFFAIGKELDAYNQREGTHYTLLMDNMETGLPYLLKMALVNHIDSDQSAFRLDTDAYADLIRTYRAQVDAGLIVENKSFDRKTSSTALFQTYRCMQYNQLEKITICIPPVENEETRFLMDMDGLALGSRSAYPEEAACYITTVLSPKISKYLQGSNLGPVLADQEIWSVIDDFRYRIMPGAETAAIWQAMAERGVQNNLGQDVEYSLRMDLYPQLAKGAIDAETFTTHLVRTLRMMLQE